MFLAKALGLGYDFDKAESEQLATVQALFRQHINAPELPIELRFHAERGNRYAAYKPQAHHFQSSSWPLGVGAMSYMAHEALTDICAYQVERYERIVGDGKRHDPINLVLEYLKRWLSETLAVMPASQESLAPILYHRAFIEAIERSGTFQPGRFHDTTMLETLIRVRRHFDEEIIPRIRAEISNASAREHMRTVVEHSKLLLHHFVQFLVYVIRKDKAPSNLTLRNLRYPDKPSLQRVTDSLSGQCILQLIRGRAFADLFPDEAVARHTTSRAVLNSASDFQNPFSDVDEGLILPLALVSKDARELSTLEQFKHSRGDIEPYFTNDDGQMINNFLMLHQGLFRYAELVNLFQRMYLLAGQGGDLLVYGVLRQVLENILRCAQSLLGQMGGLFSNLNEQTETYYQRLVLEKKTRRAWADNYNRAQPYRRSIEERLQTLLAGVNEIASIVNSYDLPRELQTTRDEIRLLCETTRHFSLGLSRALGEPTLAFEGTLTPELLLETQSQASSSSSAPATSSSSSSSRPSTGMQSPLFPAPRVSPASSSSSSSGSSSSASGMAPHLQGSSQVLDLSSLHLKDKAGSFIAESLRRNPDIEKVYLQKNDFTIEGLYELFDMLRFHPKVTGVNLWQNKIGDEGMAAIACAVFDSHITHLDLNSNGITAHGMKLFSVCLPCNKTLTYLDLGYQKIINHARGEYDGIGDEGLMHLVEGLKLQSTINNLRLGGNGITDVGGEALLTFLHEHSEVTDIDLNNNKISESLKSRLLAQVEQNVERARSTSMIAPSLQVQDVDVGASSSSYSDSQGSRTMSRA